MKIGQNIMNTEMNHIYISDIKYNINIKNEEFIMLLLITARKGKYKSLFYTLKLSPPPRNFFVLSMVLKLDGCLFYVAHEWWKQGLFPRKNSDLTTLSMLPNAFNKSKCLIYSMCAHSEMSNQLIEKPWSSLGKEKISI